MFKYFAACLISDRLLSKLYRLQQYRYPYCTMTRNRTPHRKSGGRQPTGNPAPDNGIQSRTPSQPPDLPISNNSQVPRGSVMVGGKVVGIGSSATFVPASSNHVHPGQILNHTPPPSHPQTSPRDFSNPTTTQKRPRQNIKIQHSATYSPNEDWVKIGIELFGDYIAAGAAIVVPVWLVIRLLSFRGR